MLSAVGSDSNQRLTVSYPLKSVGEVVVELGGGGVKIKLLVFLAEHLKEHYSFKMFLIMENHNFMINYVVKNFIHFCGNINDRRFGDVFAFEKIAEKSDKYTEYIYRY